MDSGATKRAKARSTPPKAFLVYRQKTPRKACCNAQVGAQIAQTDAKAVATAHPNIFLQSHFNQKQKEDALSKVCPLFKNLAWEAIK